MRPFALAVALALVPIAAPLALGEGDAACTTSDAFVHLELGDEHTYYASLDGASRDVFVYHEGNGVAGLQRGDKNHDDTDGGRCYAPDTFIALMRLP